MNIAAAPGTDTPRSTGNPHIRERGGGRREVSLKGRSLPVDRHALCTHRRERLPRERITTDLPMLLWEHLEQSPQVLTRGPVL